MSYANAAESDLFTEELNFRESLITLSKAFEAKGFFVKPFRERAWREFLSFPREKKKRIIRDFTRYYSIYMAVLLQPGSPNEDGKLLWAAVKNLGLRPCADFFDQVDENDIVEFYAPSNLQIFHNINFFEVCSYSFLEIFAYPFTELWTRDPDAFAALKQVAIDGFSGKFKSTVDSRLPRHYLVEAFSDERYMAEVEFRKFSPLYDEKGDIAALAAISRGRVLSQEEYRQILAELPYIPQPPPEKVVKVRFGIE